MEFDGGGDRGLDILASNSPYSRQVDCDTLRTVTPGAEHITPRPLPIPAETPGNSRLSFDPSTGRYTFPWKTHQAWGGTCREFVLTRDDGVQHRAYFRFQANPAREVSGRVSGSDGQPVAHATITLRGDTFWTTTADANGFYSFEGVPRGTYEATASAGGCYEPATQTVDLSRPRTLDFTLPRRSDAFGYTCRLEAGPLRAGGDGAADHGHLGRWDDPAPVRVHVLRVPAHAGPRLRQRVRRVRGAGDDELLGHERGDPDHGAAERPDRCVLGRPGDRCGGVDPGRREGHRAEPPLRDRVPQRPLLGGHDPARRLQRRAVRERGDPDAVPQHRRRRARAGQLRDASASRTTRAPMRSGSRSTRRRSRTSRR